jgi:hypothetical protein
LEREPEFSIGGFFGSHRKISHMVIDQMTAGQGMNTLEKPFAANFAKGRMPHGGVKQTNATQICSASPRVGPQYKLGNEAQAS